MLPTLHLNMHALAFLSAAVAAPAKAHETGLPHLLHDHWQWVAFGIAIAALAAACAVLLRFLRIEAKG